jgi:dienelactone hydrolase
MNPVILKRSIKNIPVLEVVLEEYKTKAIPVVIYYHGWQTSKELVLTQGRKIAQKGIRVILPDAMNHGERKAPVSSIPSFTFWESIYANLFEFSAIVEHLKKREVYHPNLGVGGVSMGGMTTCALLTQHEEIRCGACIMGSPAPFAYGEEIVRRAGEFKMVLPKDYFELISWVKHYDLSLQPEKLAERPLFFWHGEADEKIPYRHIFDFVKKNQETENGKNISFHFSEEDRHLVKVPTMIDTAEFFQHYLSK